MKLKEQASVFTRHQPARKAGGSGEAGEEPLPRIAHGAAFTGVSVCIISCSATTLKKFQRFKHFSGAK
jgi:hypothetical protein